MRESEFFHNSLVQEFYGLDPETLTVESVSIMKSGAMHRWTRTSGYICKKLAGPILQEEVTKRFGLIYLVAVQPDASVEMRQQVMRGLRSTAQLLKQKQSIEADHTQLPPPSEHQSSHG
jgi:hypothetical protein